MPKVNCEKFDCAFIDDNKQCKADIINLESMTFYRDTELFRCRTYESVCNWKDCKYNVHKNNGNYCGIELNEANIDECPCATETMEEAKKWDISREKLDLTRNRGVIMYIVLVIYKDSDTSIRMKVTEKRLKELKKDVNVRDIVVIAEQ